MTAWGAKARTLADDLERGGDLRTTPWREAIRAVPRHALVPRHFTQNSDATWRPVDRDTDPEHWLDAIYSNTTLITALNGQQAVSSSTMPGLMVSMLETLNVRDGDRVLEIGTGTGYNAALLAHRLGSDRVFSVDVDTELVDLARERLAAIGYSPVLIARDGDQGLTEYAPFDRIISTCAVPAIPRSWIEQTTQRGLILADFKPSGLAGNLALLQRDGDTATGRFLPDWAGFMTMRHDDRAPQPRQPPRTRAGGRERRTSAPAPPWTHSVPWFLAQFGMPDNLTFGQSIDDVTGDPGDIFLSATDGSWCEVSTQEDNGSRPVLEGGPVALWGHFERAYDRWQAVGEPGWERFGLTVTPNTHTVWLDDSNGNTTRTLAT
ncbi:MAG: methyltransferase domain-containing protein [Pseudonocardiaceae bacterium]|nr:methyltransferase domain-containing protein [Pseudonocardiaceae bacterium]